MTAFRYFRLNITRWAENGSLGTAGTTRVSEMQLHTAGGTEYPTSNMTAANAPSPLVASASSNLSTFDPFRAFDGTIGDGGRWISTGSGAQWLQIDLGSGNAIAPAQLKLAPDSAVSLTSGYWIVDFNLKASNTGAFAGEETTLLSVTDLARSDWTNATLKTFDVFQAKVEGVVKNAAGAGIARTVNIHRRDTGAVVGTGTSDGTTGIFSVPIYYAGTVYAVVLDESGGTKNALIFDRITPADL